MTKRTSRRTFEGIAAMLAAFVIIVVATYPNAASADEKALSGTHSASEIKGSCDKAGGVYFEGKGNGYSCVAAGGSVSCSAGGKCTGDCKTCGDVIVKNGKSSVTGVLSGSTLKQSSSASTKPTAEPVKNADPVGVRKQGDMSKSDMGNSEDRHNKK